MAGNVKSPNRIVIPGNLPYEPWNSHSDDPKCLRPSLGSLDSDSGLDLMVDRSSSLGGSLFLSTLYHVRLLVMQNLNYIVG